ncbi:3-hydroxyacyl-ACP dehydratase FabZ [Nonomuraea mesophila]|uniref:3-hydroxyacyl-[acyl-carrier-protein] dehydratase n=1 Tax=Nonomuraea mesophila TaxID=2530382 RepID=A0A4R5F7T1_9ACTN|nr:3-hydroxyacyl-ACP dehydratase FabZ [Nonomuraea mesophila]TDE43678.1 3-hydroxyacyl-ACP dehydratase FabZ [Nonomuraea mesophila]
MTDPAAPLALDCDQIARLLPHRWPMLMLDAAREVVPGVSAVGVKNVTADEPWCAGHFPGKVVLPGVLAVEAMCQLALLTCAVERAGRGEGAGVDGYLTSLRNVRFRKMIVPGDQLILRVEHIAGANGVSEFRGEGKVAGDVVVTGVLTAAYSERPSSNARTTSVGGSR